MSRESLELRYKWVLDNKNNILNMNPEFILKAESPTLFLSFALEFKKYIKDLNTNIHIPIFLDATCSGIQHLAAMLKDREIAKEVNLLFTGDKVKDIYSKLLNPVNKAIKNCVFNYTKNLDENYLNKKLGDDPDLIGVSQVLLDRKIVKKCLMTKVYGVTLFGLTEYLKEAFEKELKTIVVNNEEKRVYFYKAPS